MTLPKTDNFNGTADDPIHTYDANYINNRAGLKIKSGGGIYASATYSSAHWSGDTFDNDQYAFITVRGSWTSTQWIGALVRAHASADSYYGWITGNFSPNNRLLYKMSAGVETDLAHEDTGLNDTGKVVRLEVSGTTLTAKIDGVTRFTQTDSTFSSGSAGPAGYGGTGGTYGDTFEAGNLTAPVPSFEQEGYRFRNDDGSETTATWRQAQDTPDSINRQVNFRLRELMNATNDPPSHGYKLQYRKQSETDWKDVIKR